jgi:curved DNA-binding protein
MPTNRTEERRKTARKQSDPRVIRLQVKDRMGNPKWVTADLLDTSEGGIGIAVVSPLAIGSKVVVRGKLGEGGSEVLTSATVQWCTERAHGNFHAGLELGDGSAYTGHEWQPSNAALEELECYELMQLSPNADPDTIHRVYRILAQRYHPDAVGTGNREIFVKLCEAHRILSDPEKRAQYDARYRETKQLHWKIFDRAGAASGPEAERRKRLGILELLYAKTVNDPDHATMTVFEFEELLGCPREHLEAALWYLKGKDYVRRGDNGRFTITIPGFDEVERHGMSREHPNQHLLEPVGALS